MKGNDHLQDSAVDSFDQHDEYRMIAHLDRDHIRSLIEKSEQTFNTCALTNAQNSRQTGE